MRFFNKRELRDLFGKENLDKLEDYCFLELNDSVYVVSRDIAKINLNDFNVKRIGLRIGKTVHNNLELNETGERFLRMRRISFS